MDKSPARAGGSEPIPSRRADPTATRCSVARRADVGPATVRRHPTTHCVTWVPLAITNAGGYVLVTSAVVPGGERKGARGLLRANPGQVQLLRALAPGATTHLIMWRSTSPPGIQATHVTIQGQRARADGRLNGENCVHHRDARSTGPHIRAGACGAMGCRLPSARRACPSCRRSPKRRGCQVRHRRVARLLRACPHAARNRRALAPRSFAPSQGREMRERFINGGLEPTAIGGERAFISATSSAYVRGARARGEHAHRASRAACFAAAARSGRSARCCA